MMVAEIILGIVIILSLLFYIAINTIKDPHEKY